MIFKKIMVLLYAAYVLILLKRTHIMCTYFMNFFYKIYTYIMNIFYKNMNVYYDIIQLRS